MKKITALVAPLLAPLCLISIAGMFAVGCGSESGSATPEGTTAEGLSVVKGPPLTLPPLSVSACGAAAPGTAQCTALIVTGADGVTARTTSGPTGYTPTQLQSAYKVPASYNGATVAIVDAYDNPNAESDLAAYRAWFGLPACTTANGCFKKVNQNGATSPLPVGNVGWGEEIALDLDMASAGCPNCKILLVEASSNSSADLGTAVNRAASMGATVISNSYSGPDGTSSPGSDALYYNHPGIAITASTGDSGSFAGHTPGYPASGAHVIAVGGTSLSADSSARGWHEDAWTGAGAGCSQFVSKPSWQTDPGCGMRMVGDISAVADPMTGVAVYDTYGISGWAEFGGTSVASPLVAAILAAVGRGGIDAGWLYAHPGFLNDVTTITNTTCSPAYLCSPEVGYDGPTGLGTPNGIAMLAPAGCGLLTAGQYLSPNQSLFSCDGTHVLVQQADGNVVLYHVTPTGWVATWSTGTWANGGHFTSIGGDGNFVVYNSAWQGVWQAGTWGHPGAVLSVQDDGNMVVYSSTWAPLWSTGTWGH